MNQMALSAMGLILQLQKRKTKKVPVDLVKEGNNAEIWGFSIQWNVVICAAFGSM